MRRVRVHREIETAEELERMRREGANYKPRAQREAEAKARRVPLPSPASIPLSVGSVDGTHTRLYCQRRPAVLCRVACAVSSTWLYVFRQSPRAKPRRFLGNARARRWSVTVRRVVPGGLVLSYSAAQRAASVTVPLVFAASATATLRV